MEFNPENFTLDKVLNRHRHAFIPFSVGIRQCMVRNIIFILEVQSLYPFFFPFLSFHFNIIS